MVNTIEGEANVLKFFFQVGNVTLQTSILVAINKTSSKFLTYHNVLIPVI